MGIPKENLPKIFERFYRVNRPGREIQGTGLGLPIVAQIITRHNGGISVESEPDKGTTFTVCLPINPADLDTCADETLEKTIGE
jgi:two-component system phosphate regulon sensor histidine kinase PhoR